MISFIILRELVLESEAGLNIYHEATLGLQFLTSFPHSKSNKSTYISKICLNFHMLCISLLWLMLNLQIPQPWLYLFPFQSLICFIAITIKDSRYICTLFSHGNLPLWVKFSLYFFRLVNLYCLINAESVDTRIMVVPLSIPMLFDLVMVPSKIGNWTMSKLVIFPFLALCISSFWVRMTTEKIVFSLCCADTM